MKTRNLLRLIATICFVYGVILLSSNYFSHVNTLNRFLKEKQLNEDYSGTDVIQRFIPAEEKGFYNYDKGNKLSQICFDYSIEVDENGQPVEVRIFFFNRTEDDPILVNANTGDTLVSYTKNGQDEWVMSGNEDDCSVSPMRVLRNKTSDDSRTRKHHERLDQLREKKNEVYHDYNEGRISPYIMEKKIEKIEKKIERENRGWI